MRALTLIATALLVTLVLAPQEASAGNGENLLPLLPADALIVGAVNMEALRATPTYRHVSSTIESIPQAQQARQGLAAAGINMEEATRTIAFAANEVSNPANPSVLVVMEGAFPQETVLTALRGQSDLTEEAHEGHPLFAGPQRTATASLSDTILIAGSRPLVEAAIARHAASEESRFNSTLRTQVRAADKSGVVWFAGRVTSRMQRDNSELNGINGVAGSLDLRSGLTMRMRIDTADEDTASKLVSDFATSRERIAGDSTLRSLGVAGMVDGMSMTSDGSTATLNVNVAADAWNRLVATLAALVASEFE
ncbi:MAG: hypothetical protein EA398_01055 [Deltaproteobacteria bacterium]|nr:MAG: hypothetical protein EA398_01055 [Deltaproteobacteria bacterium]